MIQLHSYLPMHVPQTSLPGIKYERPCGLSIQHSLTDPKKISVAGSQRSSEKHRAPRSDTSGRPALTTLAEFGWRGGGGQSELFLITPDNIKCTLTGSQLC